MIPVGETKMSISDMHDGLDLDTFKARLQGIRGHILRTAYDHQDHGETH